MTRREDIDYCRFKLGSELDDPAVYRTIAAHQGDTRKEFQI